jgi:hypothetical protein
VAEGNEGVCACWGLRVASRIIRKIVNGTETLISNAATIDGLLVTTVGSQPALSTFHDSLEADNPICDLQTGGNLDRLGIRSDTAPMNIRFEVEVGLTVVSNGHRISVFVRRG